MFHMRSVWMLAVAAQLYVCSMLPSLLLFQTRRSADQHLLGWHMLGSASWNDINGQIQGQGWRRLAYFG